MKQILIVLIHDDIKYVSDRTLRDLLKQLSKTIRRAQLKEAKSLLSDANLSASEMQAIGDILNTKGQTIPTYYLSRIKKGSLEAGFLIGAAFLGFLVKDVIHRVVLDVATQNKLYERFIAYLRGERSKSFSAVLKGELAGFTSGRFALEELTIHETKNKIIVNVELSTPMEFEDRLPEEYDEIRVVALLEERLRENLKRLRGRGK